MATEESWPTVEWNRSEPTDSASFTFTIVLLKSLLETSHRLHFREIVGRSKFFLAVTFDEQALKVCSFEVGRLRSNNRTNHFRSLFVNGRSIFDFPIIALETIYE